MTWITCQHWILLQGINVKPVYTTDDTARTDREVPGAYPFTRGPYATMYTHRPWTIRQVNTMLVVLIVYWTFLSLSCCRYFYMISLVCLKSVASVGTNIQMFSWQTKNVLIQIHFDHVIKNLSYVFIGSLQGTLRCGPL